MFPFTNNYGGFVSSVCVCVCVSAVMGACEEFAVVRETRARALANAVAALLMCLRPKSILAALTFYLYKITISSRRLRSRTRARARWSLMTTRARFQRTHVQRSHPENSHTKTNIYRLLFNTPHVHQDDREKKPHTSESFIKIKKSSIRAHHKAGVGQQAAAATGIHLIIESFPFLTPRWRAHAGAHVEMLKFFMSFVTAHMC